MVDLEELTPQKIRQMTKVALVALVEDHSLAVEKPQNLKRDDLVEAVINSLDFGAYDEKSLPPEAPAIENMVAESKGAIVRLYVNTGAGRWGSKARGKPRFVVERASAVKTGVLAPNIEIFEWLLTLKNSRGISLFQKEMPIKKAGPASALGVNSMRTG